MRRLLLRMPLSSQTISRSGWRASGSHLRSGLLSSSSSSSDCSCSIRSCRHFGSSAFLFGFESARALAARARVHEFDRIVRALHIFYKQQGHFAVPYSFVVPKSSAERTRWPVGLQGMPLGKQFSRVATHFTKGLKSPHKRQLLESIGVPVDHWSEYKWQTVTLPALKNYKKLRGDLFVPRRFVIPFGDDKWPQTTWGFALGITVHNLRTTRTKMSSQRVKILTEMDFVWDVSKVKWSRQIFPALVEYKKRFGNVSVPQGFVIPVNDASWARELQGIRLGQVVSQIRHRRHFMAVPGAVDQLQELHFDFDPLLSNFTEKILPLLETFKQLHGHCRVPKEFVVPCEGPWPQNWQGFRLGAATGRIRYHPDVYRDRIGQNQQRWDALGFDWDPVTTYFTQVILPALETFQRLYGHCRVPYRFVVPCETAWPPEAWGHQLGWTMRGIRCRGYFREQLASHQVRWAALCVV